MSLRRLGGDGMPVTGSSHGLSTLARWQSGYAAACKAVYLGSIPGRASSIYKPLGGSTHYHFSGNGEKLFAITRKMIVSTPA